VSARARQVRDDVRRRVLNVRPVPDPPPPRRGPSPEQQAAQARFVALMTATRELMEASRALDDRCFPGWEWWSAAEWPERLVIDRFKRALAAIEGGGR
jgi:hypothetical protein